MTTDQHQQADTTTARNAERVTPNVVTSESIAAMYAPPATEEATKAEPKSEAKDETGTDVKPHDGKKNRFQERIAELVDKRRAAESEAEQAKREASELRAKLESLSARAEPAKEEPRPARNQFASEDDYIDAVGEWKANQVLAKREQQHAEAQAKAAQEQLADTWKRNVDKAKAEIDDFADVLGKSEVMLPGHIHQALLESDVGPHLAYYFAKNPDEAKRFAAMSATTALRQLGKLEDRMMDDDTPAEPVPKKKAAVVEVSKAPAPVTPVKDGRALDPGPAKSFDEYRARRQAEKRR